MKKFKKFLMITVLVALVVIVGVIGYIGLALPNVGEAENIKIVSTPERVEHGRYLAMSLAACMDCHSTRDWNTFAGPIDTNVMGGGGELFDARADFPGEVYASNITPFNLKNWTDGEIFRAITAGVTKDGSAIFPLMPWQSYSKMDREDVYDIIAYLRTLPSQEKSYPKRKLNFPLNIIVNTMPKKAELGKRPAEKDTIQYGAYLVQSAACRDCHTQNDKGTPVAGMDFAGGREFAMPGATLRTANITPDNETGIGKWSKQQFVDRFKNFRSKDHQAKQVSAGEFQTIMPWTMYSGMKVKDLEAIYAFLRTVKPISNQVIKFEPKKAE